MWNPLDRRAPVTLPVESSDGAATATFQPWSGRERMAYDDIIPIRGLVTLPDGSHSARMGTVQLIHLTMTLAGVQGFGPQWDADVNAACFAVPRDTTALEGLLLQLDGNVLRELMGMAEKVQPSDGNAAKPDGDATPAAVEGEPAEDPSRTPQTPPVWPVASAPIPN